MSGWFRDILAAVVGSKRQNPDSDSTGPASASSTKRTKTASSDAMREIRVRYLYNSRKKITGIDELIMLTVPEGCQTVAALRDILKKRIKNSDYLMWWASKNDEVSSYEESGLDDEVEIPEPQEVPLVIAIPLFTLYFRINGRDIAVKHINPEDDLSELYSELDKLYNNFKCGPLPGMDDLKFVRPDIEWNDFHIYQLLNMEGWPGRSGESALVMQDMVFEWCFGRPANFKTIQTYVNRGVVIREGEKSNESGCLKHVKDYVDSVAKLGIAEEEVISPFMVLENSSGTGKTQMAFCQSQAVMYTVCDLKGSNYDEHQKVYKVYDTLHSQMMNLLKEDIEELGKSKPPLKPEDLHASAFVSLTHPLRILGLLRALLVQFAGSVDQSSSVLVNGVELLAGAEVKEKTFRIPFSKCTLKVLKTSYYSIEKECERPLVILDEVASDINNVVLIRNICRAANIPIILMGTNSAIVNFFGSSSTHSRGVDSPSPFGYLFGRLPKYYPSESDPLPKQLQSLISESRPICAVVCTRKLNKDNVVSLASLNTLIEEVYLKICKPKFSGEKRELFLKAHLLFLRGSAFLLKSPQPPDQSKKISSHYLTHHFGQLQEDTLLKLSHSEMEGCTDRHSWAADTNFRLLKDDFFLHLALLSHSSDILEQKSFFSQDFSDLKQTSVGENPNEVVVPWWRLEYRVLVSACLSSWQNGLAGTSFAEFLRYFLFHLNPSHNAQMPVFNFNNIPEVSNVVQFPILGLPMEKGADYWDGFRTNEALLAAIDIDKSRFKNIWRTPNCDQIDGCVGDTDPGDPPFATFEAKSKKDGDDSVGIEKVAEVIQRIGSSTGTPKFAFGILEGCPAKFKPGSRSMKKIKNCADKKALNIVYNKVTDGSISFEPLLPNEGYPAGASQTPCLVLLIFLGHKR